MNKLAKSLILAAAVASLSAVSTHAAVWVEDFATPPFTLNSSVVNINGWQPTASGTSAIVNAVVVAAPWNNFQTVLRLKEDAGGKKVAVYNDSFTPFTGQVRLTVGLAFDIPTTIKTTTTTISFFDQGSGSGPFRLGANFGNTTTSDPGGLYFAGSGSPTIFLAKNQIKMNSVYVFTLDLNLPAKTFSLTVTGTTANNQSYNQTFSGSTGAFSQDSITKIFAETTAATNWISYIDSMSIITIPEPTSASLLFGGGIMASMAAYRKRKNNRLSK